MPALYVCITDNSEVKKMSLVDTTGDDFAREFLEGFCNFPNDQSEIDPLASQIYGQDCYKINRYDYNRFTKTLEITRQTNEFFARHPQLLTSDVLDKVNAITVIDPLATGEHRLAYLNAL